MDKVTAPAKCLILSERTYADPDIKFVVCVSTRQSEGLRAIFFRDKRLMYLKAQKMRSVVELRFKALPAATDDWEGVMRCKVPQIEMSSPIILTIRLLIFRLAHTCEKGLSLSGVESHFLRAARDCFTIE